MKIFAYNRLIGLVCRVFPNGPRDLGSIPGRVITRKCTTLKWIRWERSNSGDLGVVGYSFITPRSTLTQSGCTC